MEVCFTSGTMHTDPTLSQCAVDLDLVGCGVRMCVTCDTIDIGGYVPFELKNCRAPNAHNQFAVMLWLTFGRQRSGGKLRSFGGTVVFIWPVSNVHIDSAGTFAGSNYDTRSGRTTTAVKTPHTNYSLREGGSLFPLAEMGLSKRLSIMNNIRLRSHWIGYLIRWLFRV